jgi:predicted RNA binding protein YcfA (HicA-like mRNA interferase family)
VNRDQFLRDLRAYCRTEGLDSPHFEARRGKGGHGRVHIGQQFTTVPSGEIKRPTLEAILKQLGLPKDAI